MFPYLLLMKSNSSDPRKHIGKHKESLYFVRFGLKGDPLCFYVLAVIYTLLQWMLILNIV